MKRLLLRILVVLTILLLGVYGGQVWVAKRVAQGMFVDACNWQTTGQNCPSIPIVLEEWRATPWSGKSPMFAQHWYSYATLPMPRRSFYDFLRLYTGEDLGNDPDAWEAWFKAHRNLVWDAKQKRLVEPKP